MNQVYIVAATRTPIGSFGGTLKDISPAQLGEHVTRAVVTQSQIDPDLIQSQVIGHVIRTDIKDAYISRRISLNSGLPNHVQSLTLNRLCGSGLEAIIFASQQIQTGEIGVALAGGTESMSKAGHLLTTNRWGQRMGDSVAQDELTGALTDPFGVGHMGITAENLAEKYAISREQQDVFALESQQKALAAIRAGRFDSQISPVTVKTRKSEHVFARDEHPKESSLEGLAKLRAVFKAEGTVTAGNASGINDGAGMVMLCDQHTLESQHLQPMARVVAYGRCGVPNEIMGIGPVGASQIALERAGLSINDIDIIESNEAFAAQALAVTKELNLPPEHTNPNGGAIALGHPLGMSGARLALTAAVEMQERDANRALCTMCIGVGQGIALMLEKV